MKDQDFYSRRAWAGVAFLILIQFLLFRQQLIREILWSYPANHDQVNFLYQCQGIYSKMLESGFWTGLLGGLVQSPPSSFMLPLQGSLIFYLFGPNRIHALTLVFAYFALMQAVLAYTVHRLTGRWAVSFLAQGLLMGTISRFHVTGGLSDFRADGIASSLYGVTLCCFLLSDGMREPRWSRITICSAALLVWFRPLTGVYLLALCLLALPFLVYKRRLPKAWLTLALMFGALTLPIPLIGASRLYNYYVVGHFFSSEKEIRALEQGVVTLDDNLRYYPRTLYEYHLGHPIVNVWLLLLAAAVLFHAYRRFQRSEAPDPTEPSVMPVRLSVIALWGVVPLVILTMNLAKSPLVAGIAVGPAVLFGTFLLYRIWLVPLDKSPLRLASFVWTFAALVSVLSGVTILANAEAATTNHRLNASQIKKLMKVYEDIALYYQNFQLKEMNFATDRVLEYFNGTAAAVIMFEKSGISIVPHELLATNIFERRTDEAVRAAAAADCALVTLDSLEKARQSLFPFHHSAVNWQDAYREVVTRQMVRIAQLTIGDHTFQIFLRPKVSISGNSGGWLTADGAVISAPARALRVLPVIQFFGSTIGSNHLKGPLHTNVTMAAADGGPGGVIPSTATIRADESYDIRIDLSGTALPDSGQVQMRLSFDRYFVPKELGINPDPRKLVIQFPQGSTLLPPARPTALPPLQLSASDLYP
jgi:hypothetical protein